MWDFEPRKKTRNGRDCFLVLDPPSTRKPCDHQTTSQSGRKEGEIAPPFAERLTPGKSDEITVPLPSLASHPSSLLPGEIGFSIRASKSREKDQRWKIKSRCFCAQRRGNQTPADTTTIEEKLGYPPQIVIIRLSFGFKDCKAHGQRARA